MRGAPDSCGVYIYATYTAFSVVLQCQSINQRSSQSHTRAKEKPHPSTTTRGANPASRSDAGLVCCVLCTPLALAVWCECQRSAALRCAASSRRMSVSARGGGSTVLCGSRVNPQDKVDGGGRRPVGGREGGDGPRHETRRAAAATQVIHDFVIRLIGSSESLVSQSQGPLPPPAHGMQPASD